MRKLVLATLLMGVSVCFTGCGGNMSAMPQQQNATQTSNMQMSNMQMSNMQMGN